MRFDVSALGYRELNQQLRAVGDNEIELTGCIGQRFIAAGTGGMHIGIHGIAGNALGAYLNGSVIETFGNAQDAVGDTMNEGEIIVHGSIGDAAGYAMRGGRIFVADTKHTSNRNCCHSVFHIVATYHIDFKASIAASELNAVGILHKILGIVSSQASTRKIVDNINRE